MRFRAVLTDFNETLLPKVSALQWRSANALTFRFEFMGVRSTEHRIQLSPGLDGTYKLERQKQCSQHVQRNRPEPQDLGEPEIFLRSDPDIYTYRDLI